MSSASTAAALYVAVTSPAKITGAVPEDAKELKHHLKGGKGFINPWESFTEISVPKLAGAMLWRLITGKANKPDTTPPTVPVQKPTFLDTRKTDALRATWLGHACYYVEFPGGLRVLFDPVFEPRCSPFSWLGPKRYTDVPCAIEDIPFIDAVCISHNHYDHLSHPTIQRIKKKFPNAHFFVGLGNKKWFLDSGFKAENVTELDWWEERDLTLTVTRPAQGGKAGDEQTEVTVTPTSESGPDPASPDTMTATMSCLPCQHISARGLFDRGHTLWCSWSVATGGKTLWFAGDTGYRPVPQLAADVDDYGPDLAHLPVCPAFAEIGRLRGPFDVGLIPIGAYEPRFIMSPVHANPMDAVNIFLDTKCREALGMHWGTWVLTEEDVLEPPRKLKEALKVKGVEPKRFGVVDIGASKEF